MLLNDTVADRKAEAGDFARGLGGEERIVDAVQVLGSNAAARIGDIHLGARIFLSLRAFSERRQTRIGLVGNDEQSPQRVCPIHAVCVLMKNGSG